MDLRNRRDAHQTSQRVRDDRRLGTQNIPEEILRFAERRNPGKLMWASDYPILPIERAVVEGRAVPLTGAAGGYLGQRAQGVRSWTLISRRVWVSSARRSAPGSTNISSASSPRTGVGSPTDDTAWDVRVAGNANCRPAAGWA